MRIVDRQPRLPALRTLLRGASPEPFNEFERARGEAQRAFLLNQLETALQPVVDLDTGKIRGYEALARWRHPARGLLSAGQFLTLIEDAGLALALFEHVLREAWIAADSLVPGEDIDGVSINVSERQLLDPALVDTVLKVYGQVKSRPRRLSLEVSERTLIRHSDGVVRETLRTLSALGFRTLVDDFGVVHDRSHELSGLELAGAKLSLKLGHGAEGPLGFERLVLDAHDRGLPTTAKALEQQSDRELLHALGVRQAQGFLLGVPAPASYVRASRSAKLSPGRERLLLPAPSLATSLRGAVA